MTMKKNNTNAVIPIAWYDTLLLHSGPGTRKKELYAIHQLQAI